MDPLRIIDGNSWDIACFSFFGSLPHVAIAAACFTVLTLLRVYHLSHGETVSQHYYGGRTCLSRRVMFTFLLAFTHPLHLFVSSIYTLKCKYVR